MAAYKKQRSVKKITRVMSECKMDPWEDHDTHIADIKLDISREANES